MRTLLIATAAGALLFACAPETPTGQMTETISEPASETASELQSRYDKIAEVDLTDTDTNFLNDEQRQVVNLLIEAAGYMDEIYLRQVERQDRKSVV